MELFLSYNEYPDNYKQIYGIFSSKEKAEIVKEILGGDFDKITLDDVKDLECFSNLTEEQKEKLRNLKTER